MMASEFIQKSLPQIFSETVFGYKWRQVLTGFSTSQVFRLERPDSENLYLKTARRVDSELEEERFRLEWIAGKLNAPEVRLFVRTDERDYLLISEIEGAGAHEDWWKRDVPEAIAQLAAGLRMIHAIKIEDCPFDETIRSKIEQARGRTERGLVDETDFDEIRRGRTAEDLFQEVIETKPTGEDLVFTHGDYCLPNVILKDWQLSGFVDWSRAGIADRYQDISLLARSVEHNFGADWLPLLFENLNVEPDFEKIRFYTLLDEFF